MQLGKNANGIEAYFVCQEKKYNMWGLFAEIRDKLKSQLDKATPNILKRYRSLPDIPLPRRYSREMVSGDMPMKYDITIS